MAENVEVAVINKAELRSDLGRGNNETGLQLVIGGDIWEQCLEFPFQTAKGILREFGVGVAGDLVGKKVLVTKEVGASPAQYIQPAKSAERYPMGEDQPAQIDCRLTDCCYHLGGGKCVNPSPAITLLPGNAFTCWSHERLPKGADTLKALGDVSDNVLGGSDDNAAAMRVLQLVTDVSGLSYSEVVRRVADLAKRKEWVSG